MTSRSFVTDSAQFDNRSTSLFFAAFVYCSALLFMVLSGLEAMTAADGGSRDVLSPKNVIALILLFTGVVDDIGQISALRLLDSFLFVISSSLICMIDCGRTF